MTDEIKNFECEYRHNQQVQIINGYYNKYYGKIISYNTKTNEYTIEIQVDNSKKKILCVSKDLRPIKKLGLFGL